MSGVTDDAGSGAGRARGIRRPSRRFLRSCVASSFLAFSFSVYSSPHLPLLPLLLYLLPACFATSYSSPSSSSDLLSPPHPHLLWLLPPPTPPALHHLLSGIGRRTPSPLSCFIHGEVGVRGIIWMLGDVMCLVLWEMGIFGYWGFVRGH